MRTFMIFIIGIVFGAGTAAMVAASNSAALGEHDHSAHSQHEEMDHSATGHDKMDHAMSHHEPLEVAAASAPALAVKVPKDPIAGYNLQVIVERFEFAPQSARLAHVAGEGHAHVYADGVKLSRLYSEWMHLDALLKGEVVIEVSLNSNDHRPLSVSGTPITAKTTITVD